jgi:hypothetical protein
VSNTRSATTALILGALLLVSGGCRQSHQGWEPPLEATSTRFLQNQVEEALQFVRGARADVLTKPERARQSLDGAVRALRRMSDYYLPLLEARERAYNAHRFLYYGEIRRATTEVEAVEGILDQVAKTGDQRLVASLKEPLDLVSEAKAAVLAASDEAPDLIKSLAIELNYMTLKGKLKIPDDWPPPESRNVEASTE